MAPPRHDLGVKKGGRTNKMKRNHHSYSSIQSLPKELLVEIITKVASRSIVDLCKVKLSCKDFLIAADDDHVYHNASMDNFALVPLPWFTHEGESSFLKRCRESGNAEISYREGMVQFFSYNNSGLEILRKAATDGHDDAKYVCSMVMMNGEDEGERNKGFEMFRGMKEDTCTKRCRKRVRCFVRSMWVNYPVVRTEQQPLCRSSACGNNSSSSSVMKNVSRRSNLNMIDDEDLADGISCEYCRADYELGLFCKIFEA